jgi:TATA-binding protein-associated factor Taf7
LARVFFGFAFAVSRPRPELYALVFGPFSRFCLRAPTLPSFSCSYYRALCFPLKYFRATSFISRTFVYTHTFNKERKARAGKLGQDKAERDVQTRTSRTGQPKRDMLTGTGRTGQAEQDSRTEHTERDRQNWTAERDRQNGTAERDITTGHAERGRQNGTRRTGQAEQDSQNITGRTGQAEQDKQNRTGRTG